MKSKREEYAKQKKKRLLSGGKAGKKNQEEQVGTEAGPKKMAEMVN